MRTPTEGAVVYLVTSRLQPWTCRADFPLLAHSLPTDPHGEWSGTGREVDRDWCLLLYRLWLKTIIPMIHRSVSSLSSGQATGTGDRGFKLWGAPRVKLWLHCYYKEVHTDKPTLPSCVSTPHSFLSYPAFLTWDD